MNPRSQDTYTQAYNRWIVDQTPENMAALVSAFMPTVNAELQQYSGSRELMRARAKAYVVQAVRSFNPMGGTRLNSWVVTNLKQLSRYVKRLRPVRASEDMIRNAAELNRVTAEMEDRLGRKPTDEELQDETGWTPKRMKAIRESSVAALSQQAFETASEDGGLESPGTQRMDQTSYAFDAVGRSLKGIDKRIFDMNGANASGIETARKLGVSPAYVSQRKKAIGSMVADMLNSLSREG